MYSSCIHLPSNVLVEEHLRGYARYVGYTVRHGHAFAWICMRSEMMHLQPFSAGDNTKGEETCKSSPPPKEIRVQGATRSWVLVTGSHCRGFIPASVRRIYSVHKLTLFLVDFSPSVCILREQGAK